MIQYDEHMPEEELNEGTEWIEKLPDDCILMIFDHLSIKDLIALSLVSKRFHTLTDRWFRSKHGSYMEISKFPSM